MKLGAGVPGWWAGPGLGVRIGRKKEIADNKNPEQLPGRDQLVYNKTNRYMYNEVESM
jgi:hypothetical protein